MTGDSVSLLQQLCEEQDALLDVQNVYIAKLEQEKVLNDQLLAQYRELCGLYRVQLGLPKEFE